jgi:hypothetical protein
MRNGKKLSVAAFVSDVRGGLSDAELMTKHGLRSEQLEVAFKKLVKIGKLTSDEVARRVVGGGEKSIVLDNAHRKKSQPNLEGSLNFSKTSRNAHDTDHTKQMTPFDAPQPLSEEVQGYKYKATTAFPITLGLSVIFVIFPLMLIAGVGLINWSIAAAINVAKWYLIVLPLIIAIILIIDRFLCYPDKRGKVLARSQAIKDMNNEGLVHEPSFKESVHEFCDPSSSILEKCMAGLQIFMWLLVWAGLFGLLWIGYDRLVRQNF